MRLTVSTTIFCLLAATQATRAAVDPSIGDVFQSLPAGRALHEPARRGDIRRNALKVNDTQPINLPLAHLDQLFPRQSPPITTVAECDEYDGYFYLTPQNYTWQLQCTTNYYGDIVSQATTANFSDCIGTCVEYNEATSPGSCLAITFNGADDAAVGLCTQYSDVTTVYLADEEGGKNP
jgi:hypothetical protein